MTIAQKAQFNNKNREHFLPKPERNKKLYKDFKEKMSLFDLSAKYKLTTTRLYVIIKMMKRKEENGEL